MKKIFEDDILILNENIEDLCFDDENMSNFLFYIKYQDLSGIYL